MAAKVKKAKGGKNVAEEDGSCCSEERGQLETGDEAEEVHI